MNDLFNYYKKYFPTHFQNQRNSVRQWDRKLQFEGNKKAT